jgi:hypothetical protein
MQPISEDVSKTGFTDELPPISRPTPENHPSYPPKPVPKPSPKPAPDPTPSAWTTYVPLGVAVITLVCFGILLIYMLTLTSSASEIQWQRAVYLLSGVEAIAFAAAGFLFGKEVHRQQAEQATARADQAEEKAAAAQQNAILANRTAIEVRTRARALTAAINTKASAYAESAPPGVEFSPGQPPSHQTDLEDLQRLANELFP